MAPPVRSAGRSPAGRIRDGHDYREKIRLSGTLEDPRFDIVDLLVTDSSVCSIRISQLEDPRFDIVDLLVTDSSVCSIRISQLEDIRFLKACSFIGTSHR